MGVNGQALHDDTGLSGIWVAGVASGTPAEPTSSPRSRAWLWAVDGTMADYCDILRSRRDDAPLSLQVMRYGTGEILTAS